jgi:hypothetical protein
MPNHYHLLLHQLANEGITEFMHKLDTSYTKYINLNRHRTGRFFENTFKARHIDNTDMFLHVARYIHLNPVITQLVPSLDLWPWSSYLETIGKREKTFCSIMQILACFPKEQAMNKYEEFVTNQQAYAQLIHEIHELKDEDSIFL